jgi:tetratricopeptide (TPR) repeat protein
LRVAPEDHRLLAALARLKWSRRQWRKCIDYGERSIARALDPATLGVLHDAYAAIGDTARAAEYYRAMALSVLHQPGPFHRAWSLFLLDHDREVKAVLDKATEEIRTRQDVYGYDLLAWALHKAGRNREARQHMTRALALGTQDATLLYHAGMIEHALGNAAAARHYLESALKTNPYWHPWQPDEIRNVIPSAAKDLLRGSEKARTRSLATLGMTAGE